MKAMATIPITKSAPHVRLDDMAIADLKLHLQGVRLPWSVLGGSISTSSDVSTIGDADPLPARLVGVVVGNDADLRSEGLRSLLLLDRDNTPLARMGAATIRPSSSGVVVQGEIDTLARTPPLLCTRDHDTEDCLVVVAMRPWLNADTTALALGPSADRNAHRHVLVLVPSESASPDAVPPHTLQRCIGQAIDGLPGVEVRTVPLVWRDPESDRALALAIAGAFPHSRTVVLEPDDAGWRAALASLASGEPLASSTLAEGAASALRQWRPPPAQRGLVVMFTGLSGSGKSSLAAALVSWLEINTDRTVTLLDGDVVRQNLSSGLGFDSASRDLNIRRIGYVAHEIARHHGIAVCAPIAPFDASRKAVRNLVEPSGDFVLIHVSTPLAECERRDRKGLYARARAGLIEDFTGISSPYEAPENADLVINTVENSADAAADLVIARLRELHFID